MMDGESIILDGKRPTTLSNFTVKIGKIFLNLRWYVIIGLGLVVLLFEGFEVLANPEAPPFSDPHINVELMLYLTIIILVALLAEIYVRLLKTHSQALQLLNFKHELSQHLTRSNDWEEVCVRICQSMGGIGLFDEVRLFTYDFDSARFQASATWTRQQDPREPTHLNISQTMDCDDPEAELLTMGEGCTCGAKGRTTDQDRSYCYPIHDQQTLVARLYFHLRPEARLTKDIKDLLYSTRDEIGVALTTTWLRQVQAEMKVDKATAELRRVISQDLHDTIGQNLCFMHMQLDHFSQLESQENPARVRRELSHMRDLANESYELVRGLLVTMRPQPVMRLEDLLQYHARLVGDRTGINLQVTNHHTPRRLDAIIVHHIYFIFREALTNIEKHAQAHQVDINVHWGEQDLLIEIQDDGKGYDPDQKPGIGHQGISIMRERATSMGGRLDFLSSSGQGTRVSLWIPLAARL